MPADVSSAALSLPSFAAVFDAAPSPFVVLDAAFVIVAANQAYLRATSTTIEQIVGRPVFEVFPDNPHDAAASGAANVRASLERVLATGRADAMAIQKYDILVPGEGGSVFETRYWSLVNTPVFGADGEVTHIIDHAEDVTEFVCARERSAQMALTIGDQALEIELANRRLREANDTLEQRVRERTSAQQHTEERLRASEMRLRLLADSIPQIVWIIDEHGRGIYFNKQWTAYTGQAIDITTPAEVSGQFVHPDDHERTMQAWMQAQEGGGRYVVEHRIRSHSGEYRWFLVRAEAWRDPDTGAISMWFGTSTDVHERKLAESALGQREEQLRLAIDAADVGEWDVDMHSGAMYWPASVKAMFGISPQQAVTLDDYYNGVHPDDRERTLASFAATADPARRAQFDAEYRTIGKEDGVIRWVAAKGRGLFDEAGNCVRIIGTAIDISARKAAEEALRASEERLRQADRKKDEFLAMLAHELRNPLAPIRAAADLLQMGGLNEARVQQTSRIIARQVTHMTGLVDDLLDVSRVTRGLVTLERTPLDVNQIVNEAIEQAAPHLRARRHQLALQLSLDAGYVMGDRKRLVQVLTNLLNNAAKYTAEGGRITMHSEVLDGRVLVKVADNGIGMGPELIACAFDLFAQAERSSDRSSGGLGLGLALVRSIIELHGGTVQCASDGIGRGSTFTVCLPRLAEQGAGAGHALRADAAAAAGQGLRIMLVDDNVDAAAMLGMLLEASGHTVTVEHGAMAALERSRRERPDVFLLDIGLPDVDGNELARRLRAQPETADAVMIAVTGYGQEQDLAQSASAGFDHHLLKPVDFQKMQALLAGIAPAPEKS